MSACVTAFKAFLKENQTGLTQRTPAWVKARKHTIGASEMAVITRASPFDTPVSLIRKKLQSSRLEPKRGLCLGQALWVISTRVHWVEAQHQGVRSHNLPQSRQESPSLRQGNMQPWRLFPSPWQVSNLVGDQVSFQTKYCGWQNPSCVPWPGANRAGSQRRVRYQRALCWLLLPYVQFNPTWDKPEP